MNGKPSRKTIRNRRIALIAAFLALLIALGFIISNVVRRKVEQRAYQLVYTEEIAAMAEKYALDAYFVCAVVKVESGGRADVVSPAGAVGLMQVMPATGEWIAKKLQMENYGEHMLTDPKISMEMGCWYLRFLLDRYGQNWKHALAGYNAGQGTVDKWLQDDAYSTDGELTNIPYPETDQYVTKVMHAYEKYKEFYPDAF
ncbi:lytic transglycosylase domain-containing protein [Christensenellaceae bacterium OttesenSCG-928-L17]|nr:lytic transglycosylase domain-containing protein [Christensenellaceae bacterium OttesenSCG-928-L17]